jgi:hypothetical protein
MNRDTTLLMVAVGLFTCACGGGGPAAIPTNLQGHFPSGHLMGTDPFNVTVAANSFTIDGCDVNCGAPTGNIVYTITSMTTADGVTSWTSADCTGTIEQTGGSGGISITAAAVPGATGEEEANRSMRCQLLDGGILTPG